MHVSILRAAAGGPPCGACGAVNVTRITDITGTLCLDCLDRRLLPDDPPDLITVDFQCVQCGRKLEKLPLPLWRQLYEQHDRCLTCR